MCLIFQQQQQKNVFFSFQIYIMSQKLIENPIRQWRLYSFCFHSCWAVVVRSSHFCVQGKKLNQHSAMSCSGKKNSANIATNKPVALTWLPPWLWHGYNPTAFFKSFFLAGESKQVRPSKPKFLICIFFYIRKKCNYFSSQIHWAQNVWDIFSLSHNSVWIYYGF